VKNDINVSINKNYKNMNKNRENKIFWKVIEILKLNNWKIRIFNYKNQLINTKKSRLGKKMLK
jgi:hypothetical protein